MHSKHKNAALRALLATTTSGIILSLATGTAAAQEAGQTARSSSGVSDEIIVTARRREESLQEVPVAVSVMSQAELTTELVTNQNDLQQKIPSLSVAARFGNSGGTYAIRGLSGGNTSRPTVGTYFAEVPGPTNNTGYDPSAGQSLYDLQSVQVLKGPQGTLFGRTSTAGAVLVTPAAPELNEFGINGNVGLGSLGYFQGSLAVNIPIIRDVLAIRVAGSYNHRDGYTKVIGSDRRLDELNDDAQRVSVLFQPTDWLKSTTIYDRYNASQTSGAYVAVAYDPAFRLFNLTPASGNVVFGSVCAQAVAIGLSPSSSACVQQRLDILSRIKANLAAETARVAEGGDAYRSTASGNTTFFNDRIRHEYLINTTEVSLPKFGSVDLTLKNIFGYQVSKGYQTMNISGVADDLFNLYIGVDSGVSLNQVGTNPVVGLGKGEKFYTNETQLSGSVGDDRLVFVAGYFYQHAPTRPNLESVGNVQKILGGVTNVNLGYSSGRAFNVGGRAKQTAFYAQATLGFDGLVDGLHFTAGIRRTKDDFRAETRASGVNPLTGVISPSIFTVNTTTGAITETPSPVSIQALKTKGTNYNFSLDYQINPKLMVYVSTRKGYVPGGLNNPSGLGAPNFQLEFNSETIKDKEIGVKWDFNLGSTYGRLNVAAYDATYSDVQRSFSAVVNGSAISFTANVAEAKLRGVEVEFEIRPTENLLLGADYALSDTKYKSWIGADPIGRAPAGTNIDLSGETFFNAPRHKMNLKATYEIPLAGDNGLVSITGQYTYQSRTYYIASPERYIEVFGESRRDAISENGYGVTNVRIDWDKPMGLEPVTLGLFARNIFDTVYATSGTPLENATGFTTKQFGPPRVVGATLAFRY